MNGLVWSGAISLLVLSAAQGQTFNRDIAPIIFHYCADCHRPGEAGPFSLLSYRDVKAHARQIEAVTRSRFMPPWLPDPGPFPFAGERRLSDQQIALDSTMGGRGRIRGRSGRCSKPPHSSRDGSWEARLDSDRTEAVSSAGIGNRCVLEFHSARACGANEMG